MNERKRRRNWQIHYLIDRFPTDPEWYRKIMRASFDYWLGMRTITQEEYEALHVEYRYYL